MSRPHPLRTRAFIAALATAILALLVLAGFVDQDLADRIEVVIGLFLTAFVTGGLVAVTGEKVVTPVSDPRDDAGHRLYALPSSERTAYPPR